MDAERVMTIAEVATAFGVTHRSLRFYEQRGLLHPQRRGTTRYYRPADTVRLQVLLKGKKLGFSLEEIARLILSHETPRAGAADATVYLSQSQIATKLAALEAERRRIDLAIAELSQAMERMSARRESEPTA